MSAPQEPLADPAASTPANSTSPTPSPLSSGSAGLSLDQFPPNHGDPYQIVIEHVEEISSDTEEKEPPTLAPKHNPAVLNLTVLDESQESNNPDLLDFASLSISPPDPLLNRSEEEVEAAAEDEEGPPTPRAIAPLFILDNDPPPLYQETPQETLESLPSLTRRRAPSAPPLQRMPSEGVPRPGPAKLGPKAGLDEWLEEAKQCHYLPENVMKQLCESVKECLMEGKFIRPS
jgi:hypothetical protein